MPKPFDASTKHLLEMGPDDWLDYLGLPHGDVEITDADVSTVTAAADKVIRVLDPKPWIAHVECQAGPDPEMDGRVLEYNVLLDRRHKLPVQSVVVLLRPGADRPGLTGQVTRTLPNGRQYLAFQYDVVRVWEKTVESVLAGGIAVLPMAPLADVPVGEIPDVVTRMKDRIDREATTDEAGRLWTSTLVLLGLRVPPAMATQLLERVNGMKESATYQAIVEEGRVEEARAILFRQGTRRFGPPSSETRAAVEGIDTIERLEALLDRVLDTESWDELLQE